MPKHGTASLGPHAEFLGAGTRALILISDDLDPEVRTKWASAPGEELQSAFKSALMPRLIVPTPEPTAEGIVKVVTIQIGGDRTTDQMVEAARKGGTYINSSITQKNMPSGYGKLRAVTIEFRQFDHEASSEEVADWQNEPEHGPSGYEDGLRYRESDPEAQRKQPHVFQPEFPWVDALSVPCALGLWSGDREVDLDDCSPESRWDRGCLFARRKHLVG